MEFDPHFDITTIYPGAAAAYLVMSVPEPPVVLPPGFTSVGLIRANPQHAAPHMAAAPASQQMIAMKAVMESSIFGLVAWNAAEKTAMVAIRGTETIWEWIDDVAAVPTPFIPDPDAGTVHLGFQLVYVQIRQSIFDLLKENCQGAQRILVTGHSLGGALAEFATLDIRRNLLPIAPEMYTFAGPRAGAPDWAEVFNRTIATCYRVVNFGDLVPQVPLPPLYEHVGKEELVHGGFRVLDVTYAHHLTTYLAGLQKLVTTPAPAIAVAAGQTT